jgi:hypothetical protein
MSTYIDLSINSGQKANAFVINIYFYTILVTQQQNKIVRSAIDEVEEKTCIRFIPEQNAYWNGLPHRVQIYFTYG